MSCRASSYFCLNIKNKKGLPEGFLETSWELFEDFLGASFCDIIDTLGILNKTLLLM